MSLVSDYATFLRKATGWHPVFPPVSSIVAVGDYGLFHEGAFVRLGNIKTDFDVDPAPRPAPETALKLTSARTRMIRVQAGAEVSAFTAADVEARLIIDLGKDNQFALSAPRVITTTASSPNLIANALAVLPAWRRSWWVVGTVQVGASVLLLANRGTDNQVTITGKASQLLQLETDGAIDLAVDVHTQRQLALELRGKEGPLGVSVFRKGLFGLKIKGGTESPPPPDALPAEASDDEFEVLTDEPEDSF